MWQVFSYSKESLSPFQNRFVSKMNCERFVKQNVCEKILLFKILICSSFKRVTLKRFGENQICLRKLYFSQREMISNRFVNKYQNLFDMDSFLEMICFTKQRFSKRLWFPKLASKDQPQLEI